MPLKDRAEIEKKLCGRYTRVWADDISSSQEVAWPYRVTVGTFTQRELEASFAAIDRAASSLVEWAQSKGLTVETTKRKVGRVSYTLPLRFEAHDIDQLARAVGRTEHLSAYRDRLARLEREFPDLDADVLSKLLKRLNRYDTDEVDFDLCCRAGAWFRDNDADGMTARQVPLEGFHAKWLDSKGHKAEVALLAQKEDLGLVERPRLVCFHYLDPTHLASGGRKHDTLLERDRTDLPYQPRVVIICENKDCALCFGEVEAGICIQGEGMAGTATIPEITWVTQADHLIYWGDMDKAGFEILARYRERGLDVTSILMDGSAWETYARYGTRSDRRGHALGPESVTDAVQWLEEDEATLYRMICAGAGTGPLRIEQERIPPEVALGEVERIVSGTRT